MNAFFGPRSANRLIHGAKPDFAVHFLVPLCSKLFSWFPLHRYALQLDVLELQGICHHTRNDARLYFLHNDGFSHKTLPLIL